MKKLSSPKPKLKRELRANPEKQLIGSDRKKKLEDMRKVAEAEITNEIAKAEE